MPYTPNIPTATQFISASQPLILQNFQSLEPFSEGVALFPTQAPAPTVTGTKIALYNAPSSYLAATQSLFLKKSAGTAYEINSYGFTNNVGWTILPSGLIMKFGLFNTLTLGANTRSFPVDATIPIFATQVMSWSVTVTAPAGVDPNSIVYVRDVTTTDMRFVVTKRDSAVAIGNTSIRWFAIGI